MALSRPLMNLTKSFGSFRTLSTTAARYGGHEGGTSYKTWKMATYLVCIPIVVASTYINLGPNAEHGHRPEFVPYDYLRVRTKVKMNIILKRSTHIFRWRGTFYYFHS